MPILSRMCRKDGKSFLGMTAMLLQYETRSKRLRLVEVQTVDVEDENLVVVVHADQVFCLVEALDGDFVDLGLESHWVATSPHSRPFST